MKLLIGYDGSACADEALSDLVRAGLPPDVEAQVLSVADMWPVLPDPEQELMDTTVPPEQARRWEEQLLAAEGKYLPPSVRKARDFALRHMEEVRAEAASGAEQLRRMFPDWNVSSDCVADSPHRGLTDRAQSWGADLVMVGSHGRSAFGRFMLGSVSTGVVSATRCSVRVARCGLLPRQGPVRLLVGVDGTGASGLAVESLAARHWLEGSVTRVVVVSEPKALTFFASKFRAGAPETEHPDADHNTWLLSAGEAAVKVLEERGMSAELRFLEGDPKHVLVDEAEEWGADCLFVGATGQRHVQNSLLGTVATSLVSRCPCSVEVVRENRRM